VQRQIYRLEFGKLWSEISPVTVTGYPESDFFIVLFTDCAISWIPIQNGTEQPILKSFLPIPSNHHSTSLNALCCWRSIVKWPCIYPQLYGSDVHLYWIYSTQLPGIDPYKHDRQFDLRILWLSVSRLQYLEHFRRTSCFVTMVKESKNGVSKFFWNFVILLLDYRMWHHMRL
jgi:hypothetical protein